MPPKPPKEFKYFEITEIITSRFPAYTVEQIMWLAREREDFFTLLCAWCGVYFSE